MRSKIRDFFICLKEIPYAIHNPSLLDKPEFKDNPYVLYLKETRSLKYSLYFILPLLLIYLYGTTHSNVQITGGESMVYFIFNVAVTLIYALLYIPSIFLYNLEIPLELATPLLFLIIVIAMALYTIRRNPNAISNLQIRARSLLKIETYSVKPKYFFFMFLEVIFLTVFVRTIIGLFLGFSLPSFRFSLSGVSGLQAELLGLRTYLDVITSSIGAGLFEELIFRVFVIEGVLLYYRFIGSYYTRRGIISKTIIWSSLIFTALHLYILIHNPAGIASIFIAGVLLSYLYLVRGYGIVAYTHALYDILGFLRIMT